MRCGGKGMMERTYTIKNSDYGYPVTLDEKGEDRAKWVFC